jgi:hypothetical protein
MKTCRNCRWRPHAWAKLESPTGTWHEGRCRHRRITRPESPRCRHWLPGEERDRYSYEGNPMENLTLQRYIFQSEFR